MKTIHQGLEVKETVDPMPGLDRFPKGEDQVGCYRDSCLVLHPRDGRDRSCPSSRDNEQGVTLFV